MEMMTATRPILAAAAAVGAVAVFVAGCGGGSQSAQPPTRTVTVQAPAVQAPVQAPTPTPDSAYATSPFVQACKGSALAAGATGEQASSYCQCLVSYLQSTVSSADSIAMEARIQAGDQTAVDELRAIAVASGCG